MYKFTVRLLISILASLGLASHSHSGERSKTEDIALTDIVKDIRVMKGDIVVKAFLEIDEITLEPYTLVSGDIKYLRNSQTSNAVVVVIYKNDKFYDYMFDFIESDYSESARVKMSEGLMNDWKSYNGF